MQADFSNALLKADVARLVGSQLSSVTVRFFHVEFEFLGDMRILVQVNKQFHFTARTPAQLGFDPTVEHKSAAIGSTDFMLLQSLTCTSATIGREMFEVVFDSGERLWVNFAGTDFEPLHLIGASGDSFRTLEFHHVL